MPFSKKMSTVATSYSKTPSLLIGKVIALEPDLPAFGVDAEILLLTDHAELPQLRQPLGRRIDVQLDEDLPDRCRALGLQQKQDLLLLRNLAFFVHVVYNHRVLSAESLFSGFVALLPQGGIFLPVYCSRRYGLM